MADEPSAGEGPRAPAPLTGLQSTFAEALPELCLEWEAAVVPDPRRVAFNEELAGALGPAAQALDSPEGVEILAGNRVPPGARPVAMGYAGHQFGNYSPRLGDGRALLLGELVDPEGHRWDVHLKGSGRTPFARGGDGKATIGPMLREHLIAEAMHALGVPTTRSLGVVTTGERIMRDGFEPGAVLTRVASSHLRVGTFEYAARLEGDDLVRRLADYAIDRHHPHLAEGDRPYLGLLGAVIDAQATLVAHWMLMGFIHGVMNTDNMTISGEGIDYGPCAFMDAYDPATVFSSIDHQGRYAFGRQPAIAGWNLARFAETLLPLLQTEAGGGTDDAVADATTELELLADRIALRWNAGMATKLGLAGRPAD
ncbi:MAG: YdiU family protein [Ilumatobacteraceae bacterium]